MALAHHLYLKKGEKKKTIVSFLRNKGHLERVFTAVDTCIISVYWHVETEFEWGADSSIIPIHY